MKKLHLIIIALFVAAIANAQQPNTVNKDANNANQKEVTPTATQVAEVNQRVVVLIKDIEAICSLYDAMDGQWFKDKRNTKMKMDTVKGQQREQQDSVEMANHRIDSIKNEMEWIDELRAYYEHGSLDDLYRGDRQHPKADVSTLRLHIQLLGKDYPKKMDDLMLMAECANLFNEEYDAVRDKDYRNRLGQMSECDKKWDIDGLLAVHEDIKGEVDKWDDYSLAGLMTLRKYLMNKYGVDLDANFPYLAKQVWESVKKTNDKQNK